MANANFLAWVRSLLPEDKFEIFEKLYKFPLYTPAVVEAIYFELSRVFDSRNYSSTYQFTNNDAADDWDYYRLHYLRDPEIWSTVGWQKMKTNFNSILIVDLPAEQTDTRPQPYFYWLDIGDVIDYELKEDNISLNWIMFKQPNNRIAVFDDTSYQVFQSNKAYTEIGMNIIDSPHNLGFCPAQFFWSEALSSKETDLKRNPIVKELTNLDWLLFFTISKKHLDLYAGYPIYSTYESSCDYINEETQAYCDHGFLRNADGTYSTLRDGSVSKCPICSHNQLTGPGSLIEVPAPDREVADMRDPVTITSIDKQSLEYNVDECERLELAIRSRIIGIGGNIEDKEAINETQIAANFESKTSVLNKLKTNFENAKRFVDQTCCLLRYGEEFIDLSINFGTEFYVYTVSELYDKYKKAKDNGATNAELDLLQNQILEVEYRHNPMLLQRLLVLKQVEPFRHYTTDEVLRFAEKGIIDRETVLLKLNFNAYVDRFERENINIVEFGVNTTFDNKIKSIQTKLNDYVKETIRSTGKTLGSQESRATN